MPAKAGEVMRAISLGAFKIRDQFIDLGRGFADIPKSLELAARGIARGISQLVGGQQLPSS